MKTIFVPALLTIFLFGCGGPTYSERNRDEARKKWITLLTKSKTEQTYNFSSIVDLPKIEVSNGKELEVELTKNSPIFKDIGVLTYFALLKFRVSSPDSFTVKIKSIGTNAGDPWLVLFDPQNSVIPLSKVCWEYKSSFWYSEPWIDVCWEGGVSVPGDYCVLLGSCMFMTENELSEWKEGSYDDKPDPRSLGIETVQRFHDTPQTGEGYASPIAKFRFKLTLLSVFYHGRQLELERSGTLKK